MTWPERSIMKNCIFCKIVSDETGTDRIYEDEHCLAFRDINPQAPVHILIIPRVHLISINEIDSAQDGLMHHLLKAVRKIAVQFGLDQRGYRTVINTGPDGGQTVFHLHIHLLGGRPMHWPPG
jgi:histidine triad (HIT) family protein